MQESRWHFRAPDMKVSRSSHCSINRSLLIDKIAINIMLENKTTRIEPISISTEPSPNYNGNIPIIEYLTSHHVSPNAPAILIVLLRQPRMTKHLNIEVKYLEARMMDMGFRPLKKEE